MSRSNSRSCVVLSVRRGTCVEALETRRLLAADYAAMSALLNTRLGAVNASLAKAGSTAALPVINVPLSAVPNKDKFIGSFQKAVTDALAGLNKPTVTQLRAALYGALGPNGAKVLADTDGNGQVNDADVQITPGTGDDISITVDLQSGAPAANGTSEFGVALPGLPLELKSAPAVDQTLQFAFDNLTFGWKGSAAFFGTASGGTPMNLDLSIGGRLRAGDIVGKQGLLPFKATIAAGDDGSPPTAALLDADYTFAVAASGTFTDQQLAGQGASIAFHTVSDVGGGKYALPQITSDLSIQWGFSAAGPNTAVLPDIGSIPTVSYNNVKLDLSSLIKGTVGPLIDDVYTATRPIQPLLDVINTPLPVISALSNELGGGNVTILSIAKAVDKLVPLPANISAIIKIVDVVNTVIGVVDTVKNLEGAIDLGSFSFGQDVDLRKLNYTPGEQSTLQPVSIKDPDVSISKQLDTSGLDDLVPGGLTGSGSVTIKFLFPAIEDPTQLIGVLLGRDATIAEFRAIAKFDAGTNQSYPFGPASIGFDGDAHVNVLLDLGYDTYGARKFVDNGLANPADLLQGFFVTANSIASIQGSITPKAALDLVVFSTGLEGNISLDAVLKPNAGNQVEFDSDPNKIRLGDLGGKIFLTHGSIKGSLDFFVKVGVKVPFVGFVGWEKHKQIVGGTIFSWSNDNIPDPFVPPPELSLGYVDADTGYLHLATGADANVLSPSTLDDDKDTQKFTVTAAPVDPNQPDGEKAYYVTAYGYTQMFTGVSGIYAAGDDAHRLDVSVADSVNVPVAIAGGALDDTINVDGNGTAALYGVGGNDVIRYNGNGNATINGGDGDDHLFGGHGQNVIAGENGNDEIAAADYRGTAAGLNVLNGGAGDDAITGANRSTKAGSAKIVNYIAGEFGNDNLTAGDGGDLIYGDKVDNRRGETVYDGNDTVNAGAGNDSVFGGGGDDQLNWASGDGATAFTGQAGFDTVSVLGGDAGENFVIATALVTPPGGTPTQATGVSVTDNHGVLFDTTESLDLEGQGGSDTINVPDLTASGIQRLAINVADVVGLDHAPDTVVLNGTAGNDAAQLFNEGVGVKQYDTVDDNGRVTDTKYGFGGVTKIVGLDNAEIRVGNVLDNVSVLTGDGKDNVVVYGVSGNTVINTGNDDDTLSIAAYQLKSELPADPATPPLPKDIVGPTFNGTLVLDAGAGQNNKFGYGDFNADGATVTVDQNTISSTSVPNGVTFTATGGAYGGGAAVYTGDGKDTVNVRRTIASGPTEIHTGANVDAINVGTPVAGGNVLGGIGNTLTLDGGADQNAITLDNTAATGGTADTLVLPNQVLNFGTAQTINFDSVGGSTFLTLIGSNSATLAEKWTLNAPNATVRIYGNAGNDVTQVNTLIDNVQFFGGAGADSMLVGRRISATQSTLDGVKAAVGFQGGAGTDRLFVNDNGTLTGRNYSVTGDEISWDGAIISMDTLESVAISAGNANDTLHVNDVMPAAFTTNFYAGGGVDGVTGPDAFNTWQINNAGAGRLNGNVNFENAESVTGGAGVDTFIVSDGIVSGVAVSGGLGDVLNYSPWTAGVVVDLTAGTATGLKGVSGVRNVQGSAKSDLIRGNQYGNVLQGLGGNDVIVGLDGSDVIDGNDGDDILIGGNGNDTLGGQNGVDLLIDGTTAYDKNNANLLTALGQWTALPASPVIARNRPLPTIFQGKNKLFHDAFTDVLTGGAGNDDFYVSAAVRGSTADVIKDKQATDLVLN